MMKPKHREILARCIDDGISSGIMRSHNHTDNPTESELVAMISNAIWLEIDTYFSFDQENEE